MDIQIRVKLSVMMFLQFFIWGAWSVTLGTYLTAIGFHGAEVGNAYTTTAWAAIVSPFFVGMVADRFFSAEKVLGVMHLLGAVLMYWASTVTSPWPFFWVLLGYALCYMPTLALVNAISFHQMDDPGKEFPAIRVLGTIGWIVAGLIISRVMQAEDTARPLQLAAAVSLFMGIYSFFLPNTPPKASGKKVAVRDVLGLDAIKLLKDFSFSVFVVGSLLICIPLAFYYTFTNPFLNEVGMPYAAANQTLGQASEVFFMLLIPVFLARLGVKKTLLVGMGAWMLRYVLFAFGGTESFLPFLFLYLGILLHGICYDFFFVTGQIYVDKKAPESIRASAQGLIALVTYGAGMVIGNYFAGGVVQKYEFLNEAREIVGHDWRSVWVIPAAMAAGVLVLFALLFRENAETKGTAANAQ